VVIFAKRLGLEVKNYAAIRSCCLGAKKSPADAAKDCAFLLQTCKLTTNSYEWLVANRTN
jgi:hypothetical protein